ncbi:MAG: DHHA1 domain-containing protein [Candidatus Dormibacteraeota bacterium]|nr:DHHA1 domain-containing protein [Candidatus Dormibacteraeota bacterium]
MVDNGSIDDRVTALLAERLPDAAGHEVLVTDHGIKPETVKVVEQFVSGGGRFTLLDHHRSSRHLAEQSWATIDEGRSATGLLFDHLGQPPAFAEFARLVEDHDMWRHEDERSAPLAALVGLLGHELFLARFREDPVVEFRPGERLLLEREDARREGYLDKKVKQARVVNGATGETGRLARVAICYAEEYQSDLAERMMVELDVTVTAIVNPGKRTVSLRGRGVDVSELASRMGGGGHARAAAFSFRGSELELELASFEAALDRLLLS